MRYIIDFIIFKYNKNMLFRVFDFFIIILLSQVISLSAQKNCEKKYQKFTKHTMCLYSAKACQPGCKILQCDGFTSKEKIKILEQHNNFRWSISQGKNPKYPRAVEMKNLTWDNELMNISQRYAEQCIFDHDKMRDVPRFKVGQNLYITMRYPADKNLYLDIAKGVNAWINEYIDPGFPAENIDPFKPVDGTLHFTQVIWANTTCIGCGYCMFQCKDKYSQKLFVCNYGPAGNYINRYVYKVYKKKSKIN